MPSVAEQIESLKEVDKALAAIDVKEKVEYEEAMRRAPHLVQAESDPLRFLRFTNWNASAAAQGLIKYWKTRCDVFKEKAFLPLSLSGNGAMSLEAIENLKTGTLVYLPNDSHGRSVVCQDASRRLDQSSQSRLEATFYGAQKISENPISQTDGYVMLIVLRDFRYDAGSKATLHLVNDFPVRVKEWHVCTAVPVWNRSCLVQSFINGFVRMFGAFLRQHKTFVHTSENKQELVQIMQSHGIAQENLPLCLGGSWSYDNFSTWITQRAAQDLRNENTPSPVQAAMEATNDETTSTTLVSTSQSSSSPSSPRHSTSKVTRMNWQDYMDIAFQELSEGALAGYQQAREEAKATIWQEESDIHPFLVVENFHSRFAAFRLVRYWQLRVDTFGAETAFTKPMHQTGEGVLGRTELHILTTGFARILPNDDAGCPVLWIDSSLLPKRRRRAPHAQRDRCLFYMFHILAENIKSQTDGAVILYKMDDSSPGFQGVDVNFLARLTHSLPLRIKAFHMVSEQPIPASVEGQVDFADHVYVHDGVPLVEMGSNFAEFGIQNTSSLPKELNGGWSLIQFLQWQEFRTRIEYQIPLGESATQTVAAANFPGLKLPYTELPLEERVERRRRSNVIHCRRKRDQKRVQTLLLEEECAQLRQDQDTLRQEHLRLAGLVEMAMKVVAAEEEQSFPSSAGLSSTSRKEAISSSIHDNNNNTSLFMSAVHGLLDLGEEE